MKVLAESVCQSSNSLVRSSFNDPVGAGNLARLHIARTDKTITRGSFTHHFVLLSFSENQSVRIVLSGCSHVYEIIMHN